MKHIIFSSCFTADFQTTSSKNDIANPKNKKKMEKISFLEDTESDSDNNIHQSGASEILSNSEYQEDGDGKNIFDSSSYLIM